MYLIIDSHTGKTVGKAQTLKAANRSVDRRDNAYGAYRYRSQKVAAPVETLYEVREHNSDKVNGLGKIEETYTHPQSRQFMGCVRIHGMPGRFLRALCDLRAVTVGTVSP